MSLYRLKPPRYLGPEREQKQKLFTVRLIHTWGHTVVVLCETMKLFPTRARARAGEREEMWYGHSTNNSIGNSIGNSSLRRVILSLLSWPFYPLRKSASVFYALQQRHTASGFREPTRSSTRLCYWNPQARLPNWMYAWKPTGNRWEDCANFYYGQNIQPIHETHTEQVTFSLLHPL